MKKLLARRALRMYRFLAGGFPEEFQVPHGADLVNLSEDLTRQAAERPFDDAGLLYSRASLAAIDPVAMLRQE